MSCYVEEKWTGFIQLQYKCLRRRANQSESQLDALYNKRPIDVTKTGNRNEKTGPKLPRRFDPTKIAPCMARLGIFLGTFSPKLHQNRNFCAPGKRLC